MVTVIDTVQPPLFLYVIVTVPAETPVTTPEEFTVATAVFELVQGDDEAGVPVPLKVIVEATQTDEGPLIVDTSTIVTVTVL